VAKVASLKPRKLLSRASSGLSAWTLNIPANLSDTGKRRRLFFATERQASAEAERLKTRAHNFGASLGNLTSSQIIEAADCYELLAPFPGARLKDAVLHYRATRFSG